MAAIKAVIHAKLVETDPKQPVAVGQHRIDRIGTDGRIGVCIVAERADYLIGRHGNEMNAVSVGSHIQQVLAVGRKRRDDSATHINVRTEYAIRNVILDNTVCHCAQKDTRPHQSHIIIGRSCSAGLRRERAYLPCQRIERLQSSQRRYPKNAMRVTGDTGHTVGRRKDVPVQLHGRETAAGMYEKPFVCSHINRVAGNKKRMHSRIYRIGSVTEELARIIIYTKQPYACPRPYFSFRSFHYRINPFLLRIIPVCCFKKIMSEPRAIETLQCGVGAKPYKPAGVLVY